VNKKKQAFLNILFHPDPSPDEARIKLVRRVMARKRAEEGMLRLPMEGMEQTPHARQSNLGENDAVFCNRRS